MAAIEKQSRPDLAAVRRAEAIHLRIAGHTQSAIAEKLGVTQQHVSSIEQDWLASRKPSAEVTEERRQIQLAGIDEVRAKLSEALGDDLELAGQLAVVDRIAKLWEREARLVGLDLERNVQVNILPTAEAMASAFGWAGDDVVDVVPTEVTDGE